MRVLERSASPAKRNSYARACRDWKCWTNRSNAIKNWISTGRISRLFRLVLAVKRKKGESSNSLPSYIVFPLCPSELLSRWHFSRQRSERRGEKSATREARKVDRFYYLIEFVSFPARDKLSRERWTRGESQIDRAQLFAPAPFPILPFVAFCSVLRDISRHASRRVAAHLAVVFLRRKRTLTGDSLAGIKELATRLGPSRQRFAENLEGKTLSRSLCARNKCRESFSLSDKGRLDVRVIECSDFKMDWSIVDWNNFKIDKLVAVWSNFKIN